MTEDRLYEQLREKLGDDFAPVKPLKAAWKRALWIFPISSLYIGAVLAIFHLRSDSVTVSAPVLWGFFILQVLVGYLILTASLQTSIPGALKDSVVLGAIALMGPAAFLPASWIIFRISPNWPPSGQEWKIGTACLSMIGILGILALLFGFFLVRAGLPFRARTTGLLLGLGNGLAAEAVWRLHCPFSSWSHILLFHGGAVVILMVAGMAVGRLWERKALSRQCVDTDRL